jgi:hypothetical protein
MIRASRVLASIAGASLFCGLIFPCSDARAGGILGRLFKRGSCRSYCAPKQPVYSRAECACQAPKCRPPGFAGPICLESVISEIRDPRTGRCVSATYDATDCDVPGGEDVTYTGPCHLATDENHGCNTDLDCCQPRQFVHKRGREYINAAHKPLILPPKFNFFYKSGVVTSGEPFLNFWLNGRPRTAHVTWWSLGSKAGGLGGQVRFRPDQPPATVHTEQTNYVILEDAGGRRYTVYIRR